MKGLSSNVLTHQSGWKSFVTRNSVTLPYVLGDDAWDLVGNFCDPAWQGFDVHVSAL
jgi:hypothetical protein